MANDIGGAGVNNLTEDDLSSHSSLTNICNANKSNRKNFCFQPLSSNLVQLALEKLNIIEGISQYLKDSFPIWT